MSICNILRWSGVVVLQVRCHRESRPNALRGAIRRWVEMYEL